MVLKIQTIIYPSSKRRGCDYERLHIFFHIFCTCKLIIIIFLNVFGIFKLLDIFIFNVFL